MESILALLVPIIALTLPVVAIWGRHRQKIAELELETARLATGADGIDAARLVDLEQRVQVLERIVTDGSQRLASEIERLRHDPAPFGDSAGVVKPGGRERV